MKIYLNRTSMIYFTVNQTILSIFPGQCPGFGSGRTHGISPDFYPGNKGE